MLLACSAQELRAHHRIAKAKMSKGGGIGPNLFVSESKSKSTKAPKVATAVDSESKKIKSVKSTKAPGVTATGVDSPKSTKAPKSSKVRRL